MGFLSNLIGSIFESEHIDFVLTSPLQAGGGDIGEVIEANKCYLGLFVESFRIPRSRLLTNKLHGVIHCFAKLERFGDAPVELAFATAHDKLGPIDARHLERVLTVNRRILGPVPYRGGDMELEVGLFSVKSAELAAPFLDVVSELSGKIGVGFVQTAAPFVPVIRHSIENLLGAEGTAALEIGLSTTMQEVRTGTFALIARNKQGFDLSGLTVDPTDKKLLRNGEPFTEAPYMVLRVDASLKREDFGKIPELKALYDQCMVRVREGKRKEAEQVLNAFRLATLTSPDLIASDADRLVTKVKEILEKAFSDVLQSAHAQQLLLPALDEIPLYE